MRAVIYDDLGPAQRARLHGRAATLLAAEPARPERVAAHLLWTEPGADPEVVGWLWRAASEALRQGAAETAVGYLRRALAEPPPAAEQPAILLELGRAESAAALPEAAEHLLQAFALATDPAMRGDVAEAAAPFLLSAGRTTETLELLDTVIGELAGQDPERALQLESQYVAAAMLDPAAVQHAVVRFERIGESLAGDTRGERMMLCQVAYHRMRRSQDAAQAAALARRALGGGRLIADRGVVPYELVGPSMTLICADELDDADAMHDEAATSARRHGSEHAYSWVCSARGTVAYRRGAVGEAISEMRVALEVTLRSGLLLGSAFNGGVLIAALLETGQLDEAQACLEAIGLRPRVHPAAGAVHDPARGARPAAPRAGRRRRGDRRSRGVRPAHGRLRRAQPAAVSVAARAGARAARARRARRRPGARRARSSPRRARGARRARSAAPSGSSRCSATTATR